MFNINLGKFLAQLRIEKKLTQEKLAEILHIDKRKISRWECGNSPPEFELLIKLSEIFKVTLYELSICRRLEDDTLIEKTKKKLRTIKDLKKISIKRKLGLFLSVIFGIFLGISAIYTIDNYNTVEIYTLKSLDEDFSIIGNYIKTKDYNVFNVTELKYLNKNDDDLNIMVKSISYEIKAPNKRNLLNLNDIVIPKDKKLINLLNTINDTSFSKENIDYIVGGSNELIYRIKYTDIENISHDIGFEFKLVKKFQNIF